MARLARLSRGGGRAAGTAGGHPPPHDATVRPHTVAKSHDVVLLVLLLLLLQEPLDAADPRPGRPCTQLLEEAI